MQSIITLILIRSVKDLMQDRADSTNKSPSFSLEMRRALRERDMNPRQLSLELKRENGDKGFAYDHVRKIYNGQTFPGRGILKSICDYLDLDFTDMWKKVKADEGVYKGLAEAMTSEDKFLLRIHRYWDYLSDLDKEEVLSQVRHRAELRMK